MNKTKIILLSIGGVTLLGTLALAYFIYSALASAVESGEELDYLKSEAGRLSRMVVYPGPDAVKAVEDNRKAYADWNQLAMGLASAGDQKFEETTPASFKAFINDEAKRIGSLPGTEDGRLVKPDFGFGFDEYIHKGKLPAATELPRLQREWNDVSVFFGILIDAKVSSVSELQIVKPAVEEDVSPRQRKKAKKAKKADEPVQPDITRFTIVFTASPSSLVKVLNDIAANPRFVVAESVSFVRTPDELAAKLGEKAVKRQDGASSRRRHRPAQVVEETPADVDEKATGVVTDPAAVRDFKVSMKVAVYDFRTRTGTEEEKSEKEEQE